MDVTLKFTSKCAKRKKVLRPNFKSQENMNKLLKIGFSMEIMIIFLLFMAFACASATFIENDFGALGSKAFVYGQTWFELVMLILTIGIIFHTIWFKMYTKKKFFMFMIHISLVFIFIGAAMTRYMGYEAIMTIP